MKKLVLMVLLLTVALIGCSQVESDPTSVTVSFSYTASGDDGMVGQASYAQIRMALSASELADSWASCQIVSEHTPWAPGVKDTIAVTFDVETGVEYHFAIKIGDEVPNWSLLSNIITRTFPDTDAPLAIGDFDFVN